MDVKQERREFLRIEDIVPITFKKVSSPVEKTTKRKDIGGGGLRLLSNEEIPVGTFLDLKIELPDVFQPTTIKCRGKVIWCQKLLGTDEYNIGVSYINISEQDRKKIINYVFGKHRMQRLIEKHKTT